MKEMARSGWGGSAHSRSLTWKPKISEGKEVAAAMELRRNPSAATAGRWAAAGVRRKINSDLLGED